MDRDGGRFRTGVIAIAAADATGAEIGGKGVTPLVEFPAHNEDLLGTGGDTAAAGLALQWVEDRIGF